jgi:hypothetical protein
MLFFAGSALARHARYRHPPRAGILTAAFGALLIAIVTALGG